MRLLFLSYWGISEGLTAATVLPHLKILSRFENVEQIIFCSIERNNAAPSEVLIHKVTHIPLSSKNLGHVLLTKAADFYFFSRRVAELCNRYGIDHMICRSPMAGAIGYLVWKKTGIPFMVESFEPHATAMLESNVWRRYDPRYKIQSHFESRQKKYARYILPVSNHYLKKLIEEGVDSNKLLIVPCCVSLNDFEFNPEARRTKRAELGFNDSHIVGIYVGKFGSIYYDEEAFTLYRYAFDFFGPSFRLIILSGDDHASIKEKLLTVNISPEMTVVTQAKHEEVNKYLSASDFAFSTIKPVPSRLFCSPIKNGEYWANGLPILLEPGIGDDSDIIAQEGGGVIINNAHPEGAFVELRKLLSTRREQLAPVIRQIAHKYRRMQLVEQAYIRIFT